MHQNSDMMILTHNPSRATLDAAATFMLQQQYFPGLMHSKSPGRKSNYKSPSLPERAIYSYRRSTESNRQDSTLRERRLIQNPRADL